ncbi:Abi-alpha family protein [Tsukamurella sp. PLM1]|uniref:Abi-alpha family protein n=1 Tax=Tsukamurella sp. PLM1 TaxID=2929795 RepID=UPI0020C07611|nr:Abi-alpha family protein [Tsukamurella sp. PLM1]
MADKSGSRTTRDQGGSQGKARSKARVEEDAEPRAENDGRELAVREGGAEPATQDSGGGGLLGRIGRVSNSAFNVTREIGGSAQRLTQQFVSEAGHLVDVALTTETAPRVVVHGEVVEELPERERIETPATTAEELRRAGERLLAQSAEPAGADAPHPAYPHVLEQLCPDEARVLRLLFTDGAQPAIDVRTNRPFGVGAETVAAGVTMIPEVAGCRNPDRIAEYLGNLHRLGLIWFSKEQVEVRRYELLQVQPQLIDAISRAGRYAKTVRRRIEITPFGRDFYGTCFPKP